MKITRITSVLAASATVGVVCAPIVSADAETQTEVSTQTLGSQAKLVDGNVIQGWTIDNLQPSTDVIAHQVQGTLWEATANDQAIQGTATPIVSNLNARAEDGQIYRALFGVATPQGVNPATLAQGSQTTGKVYFDVTASNPDSVVYNAGGQDLAVWTEPAPSSSSSGTSSSSYGYEVIEEIPAEVIEETPAGTLEEVPAEVIEEIPEGSQGAPIPTGSQGTALPEGSQGTALPAASDGTPLPEGSQGTPLPEGSEGTPMAPAEGAPVAAPVEGAPMPASTHMAPEGSQGTPEAVDQAPTPTTYTPAPTP